jgi:hypothetical protein
LTKEGAGIIIMFDSRGFFIESAARNINLQTVSNHLNITEEYLLIKLFSEELLTLSDAALIKDLLQLSGSGISIDGLFYEEEQGAA